MTTPPSSDEHLATARRELLGDVAAWAVAVAAHRASGSPPIPAPPGIRPFLRFTRLPANAVDPVLDSVDADDDLREAVASVADLEGADAAALVWLRREEGWEDEWRASVAARAAERAAQADADAERSAQRALEAARQRLDAQEAELESLRHDVRDASESGDQLGRRVEELEAALGAAVSEREVAVEQRAKAVRELKTTEARLAERVEEVRRLREELDSRPATGERGSREQPVADSLPVNRAEAVDPTSELRASIARLAAELAALAGAEPGLGSGASDDVSDVDDGTSRRTRASRSSPPSSAARKRRRPVRVGRGVAAGSIEEAVALLAVAGVVVFVDGYNVTMSKWPHLDPAAQRDALDRCLTSSGVTRSASVHVVFDGDDTAHAVRSTSTAVRVSFTATGVEADDEIIAAVDALDQNVPVVVVSSDRRVVDAVSALGANVVASATFLEAVR